MGVQRKKIKVILIDVTKRIVEEVEIFDELKEYYRLIDCNTVTTAMFDEQHDVILDDESLMKPLKNFFSFPGNEEDGYCGNGIIVSFDEKGNWCSHKLNIDEVRKKITFLKFARIQNIVVKIILNPM